MGRGKFPSLGLRLFAAITSYNLGHAGVDRIMKRYVDKDAGDW